MYLALARKYRPQKFADLIGQTAICKTLQNSIAMNKLYPALIFSGMKGVGKTSTARILAKALNCEKGMAIEPCNECPTCVEITEDNSADYLEIDGASNNGVEEVRRLRETVKYRPIRNRFRVVVIDEVHMLSAAAWNALLKTIEEPPEHTLFILATTDFHKIPATIVSRCQHFEFKRIPHEVIKSVLADICRKEQIKISEYALYLIARAGEGSLRDAKKILDQAIAISSGDVRDEDVQEILGVIDEEVFIRLTQGFLNKDRRGLITLLDELAERGIDFRFIYGEYIKFLRDLLIIKSVADSDKLHNLNPENLPAIRELLKPVSDIEWLRYFNAVKDMEQMVRNTENPSIILEFMFLKLSYFPALVTIEDILKNQLRPPSGPEAAGSPPAYQPAYQPASPPMAPPESAEAEENHTAADEKAWIETLKKRVEDEKPRLASLLGHSALHFAGGVLRVELSATFSSSVKMLQEQTDYLAAVASSLQGKAVKVVIAVSEDGGRDEEAQRIESLKKDAQISSLKNLLKGKLISIENVKGGDNG